MDEGRRYNFRRRNDLSHRNNVSRGGLPRIKFSVAAREMRQRGAGLFHSIYRMELMGLEVSGRTRSRGAHGRAEERRLKPRKKECDKERSDRGREEETERATCIAGSRQIDG